MSDFLKTPLDEYVQILFYLYKKIPHHQAYAEQFVKYLEEHEYILKTMTLNDLVKSLQDPSVQTKVFDLMKTGTGSLGLEQKQQGGATQQRQKERDETVIGVVALALLAFCVLIAPDLCESINTYMHDNPEQIGGALVLIVQILFAALFFYNATRTLTPEEQRLQDRRQRELHPINMLNEVLIKIGSFLDDARERRTGQRITVWNATRILEPPHLRTEMELVDPITIEPIPRNQNYYVSKNDNGMFRIISSAEGMQSIIDNRLRNSNSYAVFSPTLGRIVQARNVKKTKRTVGGTRRRSNRKNRTIKRKNTK